MAIWQYSFIIVPNVELNTVERFDFIPKEKYYSYDFWRNQTKVHDYEIELNNIFRKGVSWSSNITLFGKEDSNNVEIVSKDNTVVEMSFRYDFNRNDITVLERMIEFCIHNGLALITNDFNVVFLNLETITEAIKSSHQYKRFLELQAGSQ